MTTSPPDQTPLTPARVQRVGKTESLPVDAQVEQSDRGYRVHFTLRGERVVAQKQTVLTEQVVVRRRLAPNTAHIQATLRREDVSIEPDGLGVSISESPPGPDLTATRPLI